MFDHAHVQRPARDVALPARGNAVPDGQLVEVLAPGDHPEHDRRLREQAGPDVPCEMLGARFVARGQIERVRGRPELALVPALSFLVQVAVPAFLLRPQQHVHALQPPGLLRWQLRDPFREAQLGRAVVAACVHAERDQQLLPRRIRRRPRKRLRRGDGLFRPPVLDEVADQ